MLSIDLTGKHALVAGVADDGGFGFAIAKALAEAGAKVSVATWPPALGIFKTMLERGKFDASLALASGEKMQFARIYPLDAEYDRLEDVPAEVRERLTIHLVDSVADVIRLALEASSRPVGAPPLSVAS